MENSNIINGDYDIKDIYQKIQYINKNLIYFPFNRNKKRSVSPLVNTSTLSENNYFSSTDFNKLISCIDNDENYVHYLHTIEKKEKINKTNFISKQKEINIGPSETKLFLGEKNVKKKKNFYKYDDSIFLRLRKVLNKKHFKSVENEQDFSSSDSYDSDFIPFDNDITKNNKKKNEIKKGQFKDSGGKIREDIKKITEIIDKFQKFNCSL